MKDLKQYRDLVRGETDSINIDLITKKGVKTEDGRWTGVVINNLDPEKLGRVQIKIYGYYDNLSNSNIPFAIPDIKFLGSTKGNFIIPELNTILRGYFDNGDEMKPIYDSVAYNASYTDKSENPIDYANRTEDYPNTMVLFQTDKNDFLIMNRKTGELTFTHRTGAQTTIDGDGHIFINTGETLTNGGDFNVVVNGNVNIECKKDTKIKSFGNVNIESTTGEINLGNNPVKMLCNNVPNCFVTGAPLQIGNLQVKV